MSEAIKAAQPKVRPAWHTDAKWVVGILAFFVVAATALTMSLAKVTERETAVELIATITATMFSPQGLDDAGDIEKVRAEFKAAPGKSLEVLPGVSVTTSDIGDKSPRELRLMIFRRLAEPIYDQGTFTSSSRTADSGEKSRSGTSQDEISLPAGRQVASARNDAVEEVSTTPTADTIGFLALLSNESHQKLLGIQRTLLIASSLLLLLLVCFSTGFGRLASPGWVLLLVSALPMVLVLLLTMSLNRPSPVPSGEPSLAGQASAIASEAVPLVLDSFRNTYQPLLMSGAGLIIFATVIGPLVHLWQRHRAASLPDQSKKR